MLPAKNWWPLDIPQSINLLWLSVLGNALHRGCYRHFKWERWTGKRLSLLHRDKKDVFIFGAQRAFLVCKGPAFSPVASTASCSDLNWKHLCKALQLSFVQLSLASVQDWHVRYSKHLGWAWLLCCYSASVSNKAWFIEWQALYPTSAYTMTHWEYRVRA